MPLTVEEISRRAYKDELLESALPHEWLLWFRLRDIYHDVRGHKLTRAEGIEQKENVVRLYQHEKEHYEQKTLLWQRIEQAAIEYNKNRTPENAERFYHAVFDPAHGEG